MASAGARAYNGGLGAVPPVEVQGAEPQVEGQGAKPPEAGSILAAEGPLEKSFCLFLGNFSHWKQRDSMAVTFIVT